MTDEKKSIFAKAQTGGRIIMDDIKINVEGKPFFDEFADASSGAEISAKNAEIKSSIPKRPRKWYHFPPISWLVMFFSSILG